MLIYLFTIASSLVSISDTVGAISAIVGGLTVIMLALWKWVIKPLRAMFRKIGSIASFVETAKPIIDEMQANFKPNGGTSLYDVIRRIEQDVLANSQKVDALIAFEKLAIFETDAEGNWKWVSRRWFEIMNMPPQEAQGNGWILSVHEEDQERVMGEWKDAVAEKRDFTTTYRIFTPNLEIVYIQAQAKAVRDKVGKIIGYVGINRIVE